MPTLTLELSTETYQQLEQAARFQDTSVQEIALEWLAQHPMLSVSLSERARMRQVLRKAGLLTELGPELKKLASECTVTLEQVSEALDHTAGQPLSEIILEQRVPKGW